jgi:hypothetical protein
MALLAGSPCALAFATAPAIVSEDWAQQGSKPPALSQSVQEAVRSTAPAPPAGTGKLGEIYRSDQGKKIDAAFKAAETPSCLSQDALKHNPPKVGPVGLGGVLAVPFLAVAALTGKCK